MKKLCITVLLALLFVGAKANDGAFYSQGNQLIPITETQISVKKEILTVSRILGGDPDRRFRVNVYYEFFNPGEAKDLLVGFEAVNFWEGDETRHPFIYDFKVVMNGQNLPHQVKRIFYPLNENNRIQWGEMKDYYKNGKFVEPTKAMWQALEDENSPYYVWEEVPYYYVYHFDAHFNKGINVIQHTYDFCGSDLVAEEYIFDYVVTAANRWANNGIDDFTLELNLGDRESFSINPTFFTDAKDWTFSGKGKAGTRKDMIYYCEDCPMFHVQSGSVVFHKKNFHPEGELRIVRDGFVQYEFFSFNKKYFDANQLLDIFKTQYYKLYGNANDSVDKSLLTDEQKRILKNVPFAYRGYVFKNQDLQRFFESTDWYIPDPNYQSDMTEMTQGEKDWIQFWSN